jgi:hypothetical protein
MGRRYLALAGEIGALCATTTIHAIYNLLVSVPGPTQIVGYILPITAAAILLVVLRRWPAFWRNETPTPTPEDALSD